MNQCLRVIFKRILFHSNVVRFNTSSYLYPLKNILSCYASTNAPEAMRKKSLANKLAEKFSFFSVSKSRLKANGYLLFETIVDQLNYDEMFKTLNLPDTFYSWFVVTELHMWMLMVRYMAEGEDGRVVRNHITQALWVDVDQRVKKLNPSGLVGIKPQITDLSDQLNAALIAYDEGLQSSDVILASALWRRVYQQKNVDPEHLDILVKYIRRQMKILDSLTHLELFRNVAIRWEPIK
ncbi:hypothetical protein FQR65_LT05517 [Abscondita terminalis]|nr:hypothetical protein FQR65_LT05517 [Abscondita terminalis]